MIPCDDDCRPGACTMFCMARRAYADALRAWDRTRHSADLSARAYAALRLDQARQLAHALHALTGGTP